MYRVIRARYVKDRNRVTGAGISSGLDEALFLVELIQGTAAAMAAQSLIQYYPEPPAMGTIVPSDTGPVEGLWPAENVGDGAKSSHKTRAGVSWVIDNVTVFSYGTM